MADWTDLAGTAVQLADGRQLSCHMLVGADGTNSVVAKHLGLPGLNYSGYKAYRSVVRGIVGAV